MKVEDFQKIGLSRNEARVYFALLKTGPVNAGRISKEAQLNRTTTYDTIERLIEKGLVSFSIEANRKVFKPIPPQNLLGQIKERVKFFEGVLPELDAMFRESKEKEESNIYRGRKGINSILNDILNYSEYVSFGSSGKFLEIMKHDFVLFQKRKKERNVTARVILPESSKGSEQTSAAFAKFRFIPDEFASPTTTFVYGNKTVIIVWSENPVATSIVSKEVAESYRKYFELLWKQAK